MRLWPVSHPDYVYPAQTRGRLARVRGLLLACCFHLAHLAGRIRSFSDRNARRILVIRTDGIGDALLFEPLLRSLARSMPGYRIHLWAPQATCELLVTCPAISRLLAIPRGFKQGNLDYFNSAEWRIKMGFALGRWAFAKVIYPAQSPEPLGNWLFSSVRAPQKWLNSGDTINQFDEQRRQTHAVASRVLDRLPGNVHETLANEHLARQWDDRLPLGEPMIHLPQPTLKQATAQLKAWILEMRRRGGLEMIGVVPSASMAINRYPQRQWVAALDRLWRQRRAMPVLLGGPGDESAISALAQALQARGVPILRRYVHGGILETAAIVAGLDGVLSVDTALAHIAVAQHVPTVALVGGGNPGRFFPWPLAAQHVVLNFKTACSGCNNRCTESEAFCITQITPDEIAAAYSRLKSRAVSLQLYVSPLPAYQKAG